MLSTFLIMFIVSDTLLNVIVKGTNQVDQPIISGVIEESKDLPGEELTSTEVHNKNRNLAHA